VHTSEISRAFCQQCERAVCYKCLLGCCKPHLNRAVDLDAVAVTHVHAHLRECNRVQEAFHESVKRTVEAQVAAATADIRRIAAVLQQQGDEVIEAERERVRGSLDRVQARLWEARHTGDLSAVLGEMCSDCKPWFSVAVSNHEDERNFKAYPNPYMGVDRNREATHPNIGIVPHRTFSVSRLEIPGAQSMLLSAAQPLQQSANIGFMIHMHRDDGTVAHFSLECRVTDTFAQLTSKIEQRTNVGRNRLILQPYGFSIGGPDVELGTILRDDWVGDYKMHIFMKKTIE
jgi:hypothetical protein